MMTTFIANIFSYVRFAFCVRDSQLNRAHFASSFREEIYFYATRAIAVLSGCENNVRAKKSRFKCKFYSNFSKFNELIAIFVIKCS